MRFRRVLCCFFVIAFLFGCLAILPGAQAEELDFSLLISKLNKWQYYFSRTIMSVALKDAYDAKVETGKNIFPSITCGQACFEGGICGAPISVIGKNQFAVRAYSYWNGKVYDDDELVVYNSYSDAVNIKGADYVNSVGLWRAYDSWEESIHDHTQMFLTKEQYAEVVRATNYLEAAQAYEDAKYHGAQATYKDNLLKRVEGYGFVQLDDVREDENGIFGLIMSEANISIGIDEQYQLNAYSYPKTRYDCSSEIVWTSLDPEIASVDQSGQVTGLSNGYALITANYGPKEACCVVCVGCNAYVMYGSYAVYSEPDTDADSLGKVSKGQPVHLDTDETFLSPDGEKFVKITARSSNGKLITGYVAAKRVHFTVPSRASVTTPFGVLQLEPGETETIPLTVHAQELKGLDLSWSVSNPDVADIDQDGRLTAKETGVAVLSVHADNLCVLTIPVFVGDPEMKCLCTTRANDLRINPVSSKENNEYGTIRVGDYVWVLSVPAKGWYRVLAYVDGKYRDGYVKNTYFTEADTPVDPIDIYPPASDPGSSSSADPFPEPSDDSGSSSSDSPPVPSDDPDPSSGDQSDDSSTAEDPSEDPGTVTVSFQAGEVIVDDWLNVRVSPSSSADHIARLANKTPVMILETLKQPDEPVFKDWYYIRVADGSEPPVEGYVVADYVQFTGTTDLTLTDEPTNTDLFPIDDNYITRIPVQTSVAQLSQGLERTIVVFREETELDESEPVATGDRVVFLIGRIRVYERIAVVPGDVNGDGEVNVTDYLLIKRHVLGTHTLTGAAFRAGTTTDSDELTAADYIRVKRAVLGTISLIA